MKTILTVALTALSAVAGTIDSSYSLEYHEFIEPFPEFSCSVSVSGAGGVGDCVGEIGSGGLAVDLTPTSGYAYAYLDNYTVDETTGDHSLGSAGGWFLVTGNYRAAGNSGQVPLADLLILSVAANEWSASVTLTVDGSVGSIEDFLLNRGQTYAISIYGESGGAGTSTLFQYADINYSFSPGLYPVPEPSYFVPIGLATIFAWRLRSRRFCI
jgi:hypothetical protein